MNVRLYPLVLFYLFLAACANLTTPSGGPKDTKPPVLEQSTPNNKTSNFKGKSVELVFDEFIKLNSPKEEIIITPSPGKDIEIIAKKTKVIITPKDGWKDSTTYTILFREGVQDITENNSPVNLKLAFSTGTSIDSLRLSGTVEEILKGTPAEKITVAIFSSDTFDIFTDTPSYFTKTDKKGAFILENLKQGTYNIYAFDDKNKNLKVESRSERYGFIGDPILLQKNKDTLNIGLVILDARPLKLSAIRNIGNVTRIRFNKHITDYTIEDSHDIVHAFGTNRTEINFWCPDNMIDSVELHLTAQDSIQTKIDTLFYIKKTNTKPVKETFKWSSGSPTVDPETGKFNTILEFSKPVVTLNFDSLYIEVDSVNRVNITKKDIEIDTRHRTIAITKDLDKKIFKTEDQLNLKLKAGKGFLYSIEEDSSKQQTVPISILWPEDAGMLLIQTQSKKPNFIVQLLNSQGKIQKSVSNITKYTFDKLSPGEYQIRVIIDQNNNGKWDPGNYNKRQVPEKVVFYKTPEGKHAIPIRANWEVGPLIIKF